MHRGAATPVLAVSFLLSARFAAAVEAVEAAPLPGRCASLDLAAGERGSVGPREVRAECSWPERQFPGLQPECSSCCGGWRP